MFAYLLDLFCLIAGALLVAAFAPLNHFYLAIICPVVLLYAWHKASAKRAFWRGFLFGLGFFAVGVSWVFVSIFKYGGANVFVAGAITGSFVALLALFPAVVGFVCVRFFNKRYLFAFPFVWVLFEWVRSWLFTGFPWLFLGYSQLNTDLVGYAKIFSVYGVSLAVALTASLLWFIWLQIYNKRYLPVVIAAVLLIVIWFTGFVLKQTQFTQAYGKPISVTLVQGDIPQQTKWIPGEASHTMATYYSMTNKNWNSLVVWPENAIPVYRFEAQNFFAHLDKLAKQHNSAILLGLPTYNFKNKKYYNSATVVGDGSGLYLKRHLVPFGEYIPFEHVFGKLFEFLNLPMSGFSEGPYKQKQMLMHGMRVETLICYESAFPIETKEHLNDAAFIVAISDDGWFGHSLGPLQHEQMLQMRAVETGRYIIRATNDGVTSIIAPSGKIIKRFPQFKTGVLKSYIYAVKGNTPWVSNSL